MIYLSENFTVMPRVLWSASNKENYGRRVRMDSDEALGALLCNLYCGARAQGNTPHWRSCFYIRSALQAGTPSPKKRKLLIDYRSPIARWLKLHADANEDGQQTGQAQQLPIAQLVLNLLKARLFYFVLSNSIDNWG